MLETAGALLRLRRRAAREANPRLRALIEAAAARGLPYLLDDEALTLGAGAGGAQLAARRTAGCPRPSTGRRCAAFRPRSSPARTARRRSCGCSRPARSRGRPRTGYCCTDGVFVAGHALGTGDYSGPAGARRVLRDARVEAAVLETARGGILRRGLAVARADVAVITSIAADHFGEYGVHDLEALVDVKLAVARALDAGGLLVVNADDALLARTAAAARQAARLVRAGRRPSRSSPRTARPAAPRPACATAASCCSTRGVEHDLGAIAAMPLAAGGHSHFNVANLATAALGAAGPRHRARDHRRGVRALRRAIPRTTPAG